MLARIVLIRLAFHLVRRLVGRLVSPSRLACPSHSSCCRFPWSSRSIPLPSSIRLVISSYRGVLLACLVFFSIRLIALLIWVGRSCGSVFQYHPDRYASRSPAARSLIAYPLRGRRGSDAASVPVLRHPVMRRRERQGVGENGKMSWTKRRDRKTKGKSFGNPTRRDETRTGR